MKHLKTTDWVFIEMRRNNYNSLFDIYAYKLYNFCVKHGSHKTFKRMDPVGQIIPIKLYTLMEERINSKIWKYQILTTEQFFEEYFDQLLQM